VKDLSQFYGQPWQIRPDVWYQKHAQIVSAASVSPTVSFPNDFKPSTEDLKAAVGGAITYQPAKAALPKRPTVDYWGDAIPQMQMVGGDSKLAIIPIVGVMLNGAASSDKYYSGYMGHDDVHDDIDKAIADGAKQILFLPETPGGTVSGTPELADRIAKLPEQGILTAAYTSRLCCSAGYFAVAGCQAIIAAPSAVVGSIGTIWETINVASALERMGIEWNVFTSDGLKGTGHPGRKLSDEQKKWMQSMVDQMAGEFKAHVTEHRDVAPEVMRGQIFTGNEAVKNGLIDLTAANLQEVVKHLAS
jgi:signal peptide peptidase SppA